MSEAELHVLRGRLNAGRLNKARRGELLSIPPIGYIKLPTGEFALDPDEEVQAVVRLVFDEFDHVGTVRGVIRYLVRHGIRMGVRPHYGPNRGNLEWRHPTRAAVQGILTHPIHAGMYRHGYRQVDPRRKKPGKPASGRVLVPPEEYVALIPDRMPAYITVERYRANQARLASNRARSDALGVPREGPSLLGGLLVCGRCGRRLTVHYSGKAQNLRYVCWRAKEAYKGPPCQGLAGRVLDQLVAEQVLAALQPSALELSLAAADDVQQERERLTQHWHHRLERARYQTQRAERQYQAVEPENRLVARELERRWETALQEQRQLEEEYQHFRRTQPAELSAEERTRILALAQDLPAIWHATSTTPADRQRIIRLVLNRVVVHGCGTSDRVAVTLEWAGGFATNHEVTRPVKGYQQKADFAQLVKRVRELHTAGHSAPEIAATLNQEGFHPVKPVEQFDKRMVTHILAKYAFPRRKRYGGRAKPILRADEWLVRDLAKKLRLSKTNLHRWIKLGWVHHRQLPGALKQIACWADADELKRLGKLRHARHGWWDPPLPAELTTPKQRPTP